MITYIEIDGFKTFKNFKMKFTPLTVIAGTNASGKSNLFDALQLLSRLADTDLKTAFNEQRGEARELFAQYGEDWYAEKISFAIEMLLNKKVKDNWGGEAELKYTRLRYELTLKRVINDKGIEDIQVVHEQLENLKHDDDDWVKEFIPKETRDHWRPKVPAGRRGIPYIKTEPQTNGIITIKLPQDGRGGGKASPANAITQTVLSGVNSVDFPHAFATKEELKSWKFLQLNPQSLREPTRQDIGIRDIISQSGDNLAAALYRISINDSFILKSLSRKLNSLINSIVDVNVYDDKANKQFIIKVKNEDGREFTSRVLSEGTLRILTLCIFLYDEKHNGLLCFEEPENGIHPGKMKDMACLLKDLTVNLSETDIPLRQVIVNTHSPVLVSEILQLNLSKQASVWLSQLVANIFEVNDKKIKTYISKILPVEPDSGIDKTGNSSINFPEIEKKMIFNQLLKYLHSADIEKTIKQLTK